VLHANIDMAAKEGILKLKYYANSSTLILLSVGISILINKNGW